MKNNLYLYGFVFALIVALLIYFNSSKGLERQQREIEQLHKQLLILEKKIIECENKKE